MLIKFYIKVCQTFEVLKYEIYVNYLGEAMIDLNA